MLSLISKLGVSYNGSTAVSKTADAGSIPATPAILKTIVRYNVELFLSRNIQLR